MMKNNPIINGNTFLVSIIVPAYNVEKYIYKCLESIMNQTYTNLEIIVVDDGSKDSTPSIIEDLSYSDNRLKIIHKENGGVSAARNKGISESKGDYLIFVDGDDYIASDYVEYMLKLVEETKSDFCFSTNCYTNYKEKQITNDKIEVLSQIDATSLLLSTKVIVGCWNKIYKRDLIVNNNVKFSESLFYGEGLTFITTVSQISNTIGVGRRKVYYYRRNNIDSATTKFDIEKISNGEKALKGIKENFKISDKKIQLMYNLHMLMFSLGSLVKILSSGQKKKYIEEYKRWKRYLFRNTMSIVFKKDVSTYRKIMLLGGCVSPWLMMKLDNKRRKRIMENSVK